jgi:hypothetical protein
MLTSDTSSRGTCSKFSLTAAALIVAAGASGCGDGAAADAGETQFGSLVIVTEHEGPEGALHYLHLVDAWPASRELDYGEGIELGEFPTVVARGNSVFVHYPEDARVRKLTFDEQGKLADDLALSFSSFGAAGYDAEIIYAGSGRAYLVDEASQQIVAWDPDSMEIFGTTPIAAGILEREGLRVQLQQGVATEGRGFTAVNWRNWDTYKYRDVAALGFFDATSDAPALSVIENDRCAPSVALSPFVGDDGAAYLVSDAALGFDTLANPNRTAKALCVLRVQPGSEEFDPDYVLDLREVTGSPGFYTAHPMQGDRLLVNVWASDVDPTDVGDGDDPSWYWEDPPHFEYVIVDLETGTAEPVSELPRAAIQFSKTLRVDDVNYVQLYREDGGSTVSRVDPDGSVTEVLRNGAGTDVQYLGRLER